MVVLMILMLEPKEIVHDCIKMLNHEIGIAKLRSHETIQGLALEEKKKKKTSQGLVTSIIGCTTSKIS